MVDCYELETCWSGRSGSGSYYSKLEMAALLLCSAKISYLGSVCVRACVGVHENVCYCVHQQRGFEAIQLLLSYM